jgi:hypothetical protein
MPLIKRWIVDDRHLVQIENGILGGGVVVDSRVVCRWWRLSRGPIPIPIEGKTLTLRFEAGDFSLEAPGGISLKDGGSIKGIL